MSYAVSETLRHQATSHYSLPTLPKLLTSTVSTLIAVKFHQRSRQIWTKDKKIGLKDLHYFLLVVLTTQRNIFTRACERAQIARLLGTASVKSVRVVARRLGFYSWSGHTKDFKNSIRSFRARRSAQAEVRRVLYMCCMSLNSVHSFVIDNCNGPPIENGLNNVCLHPLSRTFTFLHHHQRGKSWVRFPSKPNRAQCLQRLATRSDLFRSCVAQAQSR